jgi:hypothetical protein
VAFLALLALLALHAFSTMGVFVVSDDLAWVQRAAVDAHKPWNAFVQPLFADYYRPIPELLWTLNYSLWGFDFDGHQLMFILMWLAGVCAVYAVGCRLGGRVAGFAAATLIGLNDTYLLISSWKSWYTTLTEFVAVLTCVWAALKWLEGRRARYAVAAAALALIAVLSRELAPLVLSAMALFALVLPGFKANGPERRKRAIRWLIVWAIVTGGVLLALPSYRSGISKWLKGQPAASTAAGGGTSRGAYVWARFGSHARGLFGVSTAAHRFGWGVSACLVWFAVLLAWFRGRRERPELARRYRLVLLGAFLLGTVLLGVPWSIRRFGEKAELFSIENLEPVAAGMLILAFCAAAFAGDRLERMLGAWFVAGFVPVLFLQHLSNAYHLLALTALVLFTARGLAGFARDELLPATAWLRGKAPAGASTSAQGPPEQGRRGGPDDDARYLLVGVFAVLAIIQIMMLRTNVQLADSEIRKRVGNGRMMEVRVDRAIQDVLAHAGPAKRVCVAPNSWAELAGLILREKYGFKEEKLDQAQARGQQFSDPQVPIRADASR